MIFTWKIFSGNIYKLNRKKSVSHRQDIPYLQLLPVHKKGIVSNSNKKYHVRNFVCFELGNVALVGGAAGGGVGALVAIVIGIVCVLRIKR